MLTYASIIDPTAMYFDNVLIYLSISQYPKVLPKFLSFTRLSRTIIGSIETPFSHVKCYYSVASWKQSHYKKGSIFLI